MRIPKWNLFQVGIVLVALPVISQLIVAGLLIWLLNQAEAERQRETQAKIRLMHCNEAARQMSRVTSLMLSSLIPGSANEMVQYRNFALARQHLNQLRRMPAFSDEERESINRFADLFEECSESFMSAHGSFDDGVRILELLDSGKGITHRLFLEGERLANTDFLTQSGAGSRKAIQLILIVGLVLNIVVAFTLARVFAIAIRQRIGRVTNNSILLANGKALPMPMRGYDEISELDRQFHKTADALYEAQKKERALTHYAVDAIFSLDGSGKFSKVNPAAVRAWGYTSEELLSKNLVELFHENKRTDVAAYLSNSKESKSEAETFEGEIVCRDGTTSHFLFSINYSPSEDAFFCVAHDITERKAVEELKQRFVAMVSHDLRSPLASTLASMHLITSGAAGEASEGVLAHAKVADRNLGRLINLVNDLLDAERLSSGLMPMQFENIMIASVIENAIEAVQSLADEKNVDIVAEGSLLQVYGDRGKLIQVVVNLLSNAIKYSPEGETITVSTLPSDAYTQVQITDNGKGIPEKFQQHIFEQFKQVELSDADSNKGSGLGLSICKAIVEQHSGEIGVTSRTGDGSTFWFRIPKIQSFSSPIA